MISRILNVVNVVRHFLVMERYFPDINLRDMRRYCLDVMYDFGRTRSPIARTILRGRHHHSMVGPSDVTHNYTRLMMFEVIISTYYSE